MMVFRRSGMTWVYRTDTDKQRDYVEMLNAVSDWYPGESHWIVPGTWE